MPLKRILECEQMSPYEKECGIRLKEAGSQIVRSLYIRVGAMFSLADVSSSDDQRRSAGQQQDTYPNIIHHTIRQPGIMV
ncbi:hypothetical protein TNCV_3631721 [Trichonephila clavipes]|nr:hypothetical protein TNCV_3631721 [Trichonephila clavipes]